MNFKQLKYFVTIVEEGSISAAAKKLFITQPPLTIQIQELEKELGCALFTRTSRKIILTEAGRILYERAIPILKMLNIAAEEVKDYSCKSIDTIRIGMISSVTTGDIAGKLASFVKNNPRTQLDIYESNTYNLLELLKNKAIHFAVVRSPFPDFGFKKVVLDKGKIIALGQKQFFNNILSETTNSIALQNLANFPLLIYHRWEKVFTATLNELGVHAHIICKSDDARTCLLLAEKGMGIALLPDSLISNTSLNLDLTYFEIETDPWTSDIFLLYNEDAYMPKGSYALIDFLQEN